METISPQKLTGATLHKNASACFDRIVENISNAPLLREGLNPSVTRLHEQTLRLTDYHLKTKNGISATSNRHMRPEPFYGTGQGATDVTACKDGLY
jgi:hypothetical protein